MVNSPSPSPPETKSLKPSNSISGLGKSPAWRNRPSAFFTAKRAAAKSRLPISAACTAPSSESSAAAALDVATSIAATAVLQVVVIRVIILNTGRW